MINFLTAFFQALNGCLTYIFSLAGALAYLAGYVGLVPSTEAQTASVLCAFIASICLRFAHAQSTEQLNQAISQLGPPSPSALGPQHEAGCATPLKLFNPDQI